MDPEVARQTLFEDLRQIRSALGHLENNGLSVISPLALRAGQLEHLLQAALPLATRKTFATYFHREFQLFADRIQGLSEVDATALPARADEAMEYCERLTAELHKAFDPST